MNGPRTFLTSAAIALWGLALLILILLNERARFLDTVEESVQDRLAIELDRCQVMAARGRPQESVLLVCVEGRRPHETKLRDIESRRRDVNRLRVAFIATLVVLPMLALAVSSATRAGTEMDPKRPI